MTTRPQLAINNDLDPDDPFADLIEAIQTNQLEFGDGPPEQQTPTYHRHQLLNPDFWFFAGAWFLLLLCFTSFFPRDVFEQLLFASLILMSAGIVCNLTREKQGIVVHENREHITINIKLPRWAGFGYVPAHIPLVERVKW